MILLDSNVIAELVRSRPDPIVVAFLRRQPPQSLFTAVVCESEIRYGLARMPPGRRRSELAGRITAFLTTAFPNCIMAFESAVAAVCGAIRATREAAGKPVTVQDAMIAATARAYGLSIATRNDDDFSGCGVLVVNPWLAE